LAAVPPRKSEILRSIEYYEKILPELSVDVKLNTEADCEELNKFDHVILAIGAHNMDLPMSVTDSNVVSAWDVLAGCEVSGACAVLGGGLVGTETAEISCTERSQSKHCRDAGSDCNRRIRDSNATDQKGL